MSAPKRRSAAYLGELRSMKFDAIAARSHGLDVAKLTAAWTAWFWSFNWNVLGGFLSCVLTLLFILDKLGLLSPVKRRCVAGWDWVLRRSPAP
jgi:hypothetical protein